ncbi:MAG: hypothetical protein LBJ12_01515 [Oscillospiraceae bacterium]|jgi:hypothetical protein|nr:hypothetical protein [Oscillospiraceae bacterium]
MPELPNIGDYFNEPDLSGVDIGQFFQDLFQYIATGFARIFQSGTWDTIWNRIVQWFGWAYLVPPEN